MGQSNEKQTATRRRDREYVLTHLSHNPCSVCEEENPAALEFHHRDKSEKRHSISRMVSNGVSLVALQAEIDKCDVLCANCHRKQEARDGEWYKGVFEYD